MKCVIYASFVGSIKMEREIFAGYFVFVPLKLNSTKNPNQAIQYVYGKVFFVKVSMQ